jgi:hypothetical protein
VTDKNEQKPCQSVPNDVPYHLIYEDRAAKGALPESVLTVVSCRPRSDMRIRSSKVLRDCPTQDGSVSESADSHSGYKKSAANCCSPNFGWVSGPASEISDRYLKSLSFLHLLFDSSEMFP